MKDLKDSLLAKCEAIEDSSTFDAYMKDTMPQGFRRGSDAEYKRLMPIIRELLDICEAQANEIGDMRKQFEWYDKVFNGEEHEFAHWWRVEIPYQMDRALTATTERLKQLAGEGE